MKTVIFGGTFDPLHNAHLQILEKAQNDYGFDRVVLLPSNRPPHKCGAQDAQAQLSMLNHACLHRPTWGVDCYEYQSTTVHYTSDTVKALKKIYGEFTFLMGGDSMIDFHTWHQPQTIVQEVPLLVACRRDIKAVQEAADEYIAKHHAKIEIMQYENDISSSCIRAMCELSMDIDGMVPPFVQTVIKEKKLYRKHARFVEIVKGKVNPQRFQHICRTVLCGVKLNEKIKLSFDDVFLACLLHDVTKDDKESVYDFLLPCDCLDSPVRHAFSGAYFVRELGLGENIANAVYSHCTGMPDMDDLQKLVYLADLIEEGHEFAGIEELRRLSFFDFNTGFLAALKHQYEYLKNGTNNIYPLTIKTYNYYFGGKNEQ